MGKATFPHLFRQGIMVMLLTVLGCLLMNMTASSMAVAEVGGERSRIPAVGGGPYELYIFTDYFCGPCQSLEAELDTTLRELLVRNSVRISFVDLPIHRETIIFNRYFLYAAHAAGSGRELLRARTELFALAKEQDAADEKMIVSLFKKRNIAFKVYDLKPVYPQLNRIIKQFNVRSTPTCVVRYSSTDIRTYTGGTQIKQGMAVLLTATARSK